MTQTLDDLSLIPPRRLGERLRVARTSAGLTLTALAAAASEHFRDDELAEIEAGQRVIADHEIRFLGSLLGVELDVIRPHRTLLVLDRAEPRSPGGSAWHGAPGPLADDEVLQRYLALIYALRGVKPGRFIVPRGGDLEVLAEATARTSAAVRCDLEAHMRDRRDELARLRDSLGRRVCVPPLGLLVALTVAGALVLVPPPETIDVSGSWRDHADR